MERPEEKEEKNRRGLRGLPLALLIAAAAVVTLLAAAYGAGVYHFRDRFPFHTSYRGRDVSCQTLDILGAIDEEAAGARTITVNGRGGASVTYALDEWLDYTETGRTPPGGFLPSPWQWPRSLREATVLPADVERSYDETRVNALLRDVEALHGDDAARPENAYVYRVGYHYYIEPEVEGSSFRVNTLRTLLREAVADFIRSEEQSLTVDLDSAGAYLPPRVRSDDAALMLERDNLDAIRGQTITIDLTGRTEELTAEDIMAFHTFDEDGRVGPLDTDLVYGYVAGLKETYDTYERSVPFVNSRGETVYVGTWRDTYGFQMDLDATYEVVLEALTDHLSGTVEPVWTHKANGRSETGSDLGDTYIEVSVRDQYLWAYKDGECVLTTNVVTGNRGDHDTPLGEFYIMYMQRDATLVGDDYESHVDYWMPITMSGVGLHDASWRSNYGGSIYQGNGSHGCINLPNWAARELFWSFSSGTPVVIWA